MLSLLVTLLVACLFASVAYWALTLLPLPAPVKQVALFIAVLIILVFMIQALGFLGGRPWFR